MTKVFQDSHATLYNADCRNMSELADETVQCCVTSPPYWGLRKYAGVPDLIWDGEPECVHEFVGAGKRNFSPQQDASGGVGGGRILGTRGEQGWTAGTGSGDTSLGAFCIHCSAWRGSFGLEPTPELYVQHTIRILREVWRVLRKDGVVFWNIGDSYAAAQGGRQSAIGEIPSDGNGRTTWGQGIPRGDVDVASWSNRDVSGRNMPSRASGLKPKDLVLMPFRVALAAQADGWWVRSVIIWSKPNPMPESVTDRPTTSHEYILMLTKSGASQYWTHRDLPGTRRKPKADWRWVHRATGEEVTEAPDDWKVKTVCQECEGTGKVDVYLGLDAWQENVCTECKGKGEVKRWKRVNLWTGHDYYWDQEAVREGQSSNTHSRGTESGGRASRPGPKSEARGDSGIASWLQTEANQWTQNGRNIRSVWEFPTRGFPDAHFAVFPEKLPETCIKAATPEKGCCSECGAPWARILSEGFTDHDAETESAYEQGSTANRLAKLRQSARAQGGEYANKRETTGWRPTCSCDAPTVPSLVLDCFAGAGTTLKVAKNLGRRAVGYELSEEYCQLAIERCRQQVMELRC